MGGLSKIVPRPQKYRDVVKFLNSKGWVLLRQQEGSHEKWGNPENGREYLAIPHHEVSAGIVKQLIDMFPDAPSGWK